MKIGYQSKIFNLMSGMLDTQKVFTGL